MLKVNNSLQKKIQKFEPLREGFAGVYVCGPTVYGHSHIGHAKSYVSFDVIVRYLRHLGYKVRYVQNITDVGHLTDDADEGEDKIIKKAREAGLEPMEVAEAYTRSYFEDMDALNVQRPDISPRASGHIPEQIDMVAKLIENGHAYETGGNVYYDITSFPAYGKLSGRSVDELSEGARVELRKEKRNAADFALWKRAEEGHLMKWNSPWSVGFPGWHLECSAMALRYLGPVLDIHGGGLENVFPHHEDEIAQAEGITGKQFARYWLHNNMVTVEGRKMGKSLGNFITLKDAFAGEPPLETKVRPLVLRYFILNSHYRSPLDFSARALEGAKKGLERIEATYNHICGQLAGSDVSSEYEKPPEKINDLVVKTKQAFHNAMNDDFNTAGALGELNKYTRNVNKLLENSGNPGKGALQAMKGTYYELAGEVLGILGEAGEKVKDEHIPASEDLIEAMIETRNALREARRFDLADGIRDRLSRLGVELEDSEEGTRWKRV